MLKIIYSIPILLLLVIPISCNQSEKKAVEKTESKTPQVIISNFQSLSGEPIEMGDYKGKKVFLNFWATWCKPCLEEMPDIEKVAKILEQENYVVLLASDEPIKKIQDFADKKGYELDFIRFSGSIEEWNIYATPTTLLINSKGEIEKRLVGVYEWTSEEVLTTLREIQ